MAAVSQRRDLLREEASQDEEEDAWDLNGYNSGGITTRKVDKTNMEIRMNFSEQQ